MNRIILLLLYTLTLLAVVYLIVTGSNYYTQPIVERPHHVLHNSWKPSGLIGHGLGVVGSTLMIILLLYMARKRWRFMQRWGDIRWWLNYHIWMGITGPLLVVFHTCFKFGGIVSVSFWSMIAVALSGVLGRYIYVQIPRAVSGQELSQQELDAMDSALQKQMQERYQLDTGMLARISNITGQDENENRSGWLSLWNLLKRDLSFRSHLAAVRREVLQQRTMPRYELSQLLRLVEQRAKLKRRMAFLSTAQSLLHHWHVIHKPFALVMLIIMVVHVVITLLFGYHWIF